MKRKIACAFLLIALTFSMSSCFLLRNLGLQYDTPGETVAGDTYVTVEEVKDYGDIVINSNQSSDILAASKALLSSVSISAIFTKKNANSSGLKEYYAMGSGVIYKMDKKNGDAYIITNYHVVYDSAANTTNRISNEINVYLYGQEFADYAIPATYVGGSMQCDIAVLKVKGSTVLMKSNAVAASFANSDDIAVLETAIAVGNPEGNGISATVGHVNVDSEYITMLGSDNKTSIELRVIRTDAAVNSGNSGGGLFNAKGELIGIVNAKVADTSVDNIGYAIPSNVAKYFTQNIIDFCDGTAKETPYRCYVGIMVQNAEAYTVIDEQTGKIRKMEKVSVKSLADKTHAKGVLEEGDVITAITIDGKKYEVTRLFHVTDNMLNARPGSSVVFHVIRDGKAIETKLTMTDNMLEPYN